MCCSSIGLGLFLFCLVIVSSSSGLFSWSFPPVSELPVNYTRGSTGTLIIYFTGLIFVRSVIVSKDSFFKSYTFCTNLTYIISKTFLSSSMDLESKHFMPVCCLTDQWSLGIRQELPKLSQQVFLSLEKTGNLRKHLIFGHPTGTSTATTLLYLQLLLLRVEGGKIMFKGWWEMELEKKANQDTIL